MLNLREDSFLRRLLLAGGCLALLWLPSGCREEREKISIREVVGTIEEIDLNRQQVKVRAYIEKHETYDTFTVEVTPDTEILINGSLATLADVRVGERAEGTVEVARRDGATVLTARAVTIERGEVLTAPGAQAGAAGDADQPADAGSAGVAPPGGSAP